VKKERKKKNQDLPLALNLEKRRNLKLVRKENQEIKARLE